MSLIPTNNFNNNNNHHYDSLTPFTPFSSNFWNNFFSTPFPFPFPFRSRFPSFSLRTVPYSELSIETSGNIRARLECKEIDEAHIIVSELPGIEKNEVEVVGENGGFLRVCDIGGNGRFYWRLRLPWDSNPGSLSWSMENGVLTVVVPKMGVGVDYYGDFVGSGNVGGVRGRNIRQIEIEGSD